MCIGSINTSIGASIKEGVCRHRVGETSIVKDERMIDGITSHGGEHYGCCDASVILAVLASSLRHVVVVPSNITAC